MFAEVSEVMWVDPSRKPFPSLTVSEFATRLRVTLKSYGFSVPEAAKRANISRSRAYEVTNGEHLPSRDQLKDLIGECAPDELRADELTWWTEYWRAVTVESGIAAEPAYGDSGQRGGRMDVPINSEPRISRRHTNLPDMSKVDWYWPERRTGDREQNAAEVWIISPDLYWDYDDREYSELVRQNLVAGTRYRYLYRATPENTMRATELTEEFGLAVPEDPRRAEFRAVPEDDFLWCAEHVIFDPHTDHETALIVDIWSEKDKSAKADIEMGRTRRALFRRQFETTWTRFEPCS